MGRIKVVDEAWLGLALLHREHPERDSFTVEEIVDRIAREDLCKPLRPGVYVHISQHSVASKQPHPANYRMMTETERGKRRLFRQGDPVHPHRTGKITPFREDIPEQYWPLIQWYLTEYDQGATSTSGIDEVDNQISQRNETEMTQAQLIQQELNRRFAAARAAGLQFIDILALDLHNAIAAHWNNANRIPNVCRIMWNNRRPNDHVLHTTTSGQSSTLEIRYILPR
jgi:hypothetical protein